VSFCSRHFASFSSAADAEKASAENDRPKQNQLEQSGKFDIKTGSSGAGEWGRMARDPGAHPGGLRISVGGDEIMADEIFEAARLKIAARHLILLKEFPTPRYFF
jgi:hypothetical protein